MAIASLIWFADAIGKRTSEDHRSRASVIRIPLRLLLPYHGSGPAYHVCGGDQGYKGLGWRFSCGSEHDRFLEFGHSLAESKSIMCMGSKLNMLIRSATSTLALFPALGTSRRSRPSRKHDPLCGQQLLDFGLLAKLA